MDFGFTDDQQEIKRTAHDLLGQRSTLERVRDDLNIEFGRLQLEQATWGESNRIDQVARDRLGMKFPEGNEIVVIRP